MKTLCAFLIISGCLQASARTAVPQPTRNPLISSRKLALEYAKTQGDFPGSVQGCRFTGADSAALNTVVVRCHGHYGMLMFGGHRINPAFSITYTYSKIDAGVYALSAVQEE